jgi:hypothetical protein
MGYHFTPQSNGKIKQLGGQFDGSKTVKLFRRVVGGTSIELASTTVTSTNNGWGYTDITPIVVQAGVQYTVAVYLNGSGGTYRRPPNNYFPKTHGDIRIDYST